MNDNAKRWVEALKSGKYEQAKNVLKDGDKFCCLGVACDISGLGKWKTEADTNNTYYDCRDEVPENDIYCNRNYKNDVLTEKVQKWLGLNSKVGKVVLADNFGTFTYLTELNDEMNFSFEKIAKTIEEHPELFEEYDEVNS